MTDDEAKMAARDRLHAMEHPRGRDLYRHYKGGIYEVIMLGFDEDDPSVFRVGYRSLCYGSRQFRTLENWTELVEADGQMVPRFKLLVGEEAEDARHIRVR